MFYLRLDLGAVVCTTNSCRFRNILTWARKRRRTFSTSPCWQAYMSVETPRELPTRTFATPPEVAAAISGTAALLMVLFGDDEDVQISTKRCRHCCWYLRTSYKSYSEEDSLKYFTLDPPSSANERVETEIRNKCKLLLCQYLS